MFNLKRLQLLHDLAIAKTITEVARLHGLTRPAVSRQLSLLEQEMGTRLFEQSGRGVRLTGRGEYLVRQTSQVLALLEETRNHINRDSDQMPVTVRIATFGSAINALIPSVMNQLQAQACEIRVQALEYESSDAMRAVASREADLALVLDALHNQHYERSLHLSELGTDMFVAVLPHTHPLANETALQLKDLANDIWSVNTASQNYHDTLMTACRQGGFEPRIGASCRNTLASLNLVAQCGYVTVLPYFAVHRTLPGENLKVVPVTPRIARKVFLLTRRASGHDAALHTVSQALQRAAAQVQQQADAFVLTS